MRGQREGEKERQREREKEGEIEVLTLHASQWNDNLWYPNSVYNFPKNCMKM